MRLKLTSLILIGMLLVGLGAGLGIAEEASEVKGILARLRQELGRLPSLQLQELLARLQVETERALEASDTPTVAGSGTVPAGFGTFTYRFRLVDVRGFVLGSPQYLLLEPPLIIFPCCDFAVEQSLNRVSRFDPSTGFPVPFATGLSTPTDLLAAPGFFSPPFRSFLYVTETGANRVSRIDTKGAVTTFASFTSAPKRMAFSPDFGAFGTFLFVTLADGRLVKVDPTGTVSPCASGLAGPEGLVFGPGGSAFKDVLFVAESTANKISKVNSDCTVSPFASTGLIGPVTIAMSPGGGWGALDTLYVVNAGGTRIDRVDKNGSVTAFASSLTQADTIKLPTLSPFARLPDFRMHISHNITSTTGDTIEAVFVRPPFILFSWAGCIQSCRAGDTIVISVKVENPSPLTVPVEIKGFFRNLDGTPLFFAPLLGDNKHFETVLPSGFQIQVPWFTLTLPTVPPGQYCYMVDMRDAESFDQYRGILYPLPYPFLYTGQCFNVLP